MPDMIQEHVLGIQPSGVSSSPKLVFPFLPQMALSRRRLPTRIHFSPHNYLQACTTNGRSIGRKVALEHENNMGAEGVRPHIIIMLTDGQATVGFTNSDTILKNVREKNKEGASIFCLGFGNEADMDLLERIAHQNKGTARKIYEDMDAAEQLQGFYQELSTPLLLDVQFSYSNEAVQMNSLSSTHFYNYFQGTELVVTGQTELDNFSGIKANITGQGRNGHFFMGVTGWNTVNPPDKHLLSHLHLAPTPKNFIERLWAFLKVKDLLNEVKAARGYHEKTSAQKKALKIALEHHFVTPLTSLVVVQPDQENCKDYEDDDEEEEKEEEGTSDQTAITKTVDNTSLYDSLDTQDSVVRRFDAASIQVVSNGEDWQIMEYEQPSREQFAFGGWGGSSANHPSVPLLMITMILLASIFSSQTSGLRVHLPDK